MLKINKIRSHKKIWLDSMVGMTWGFIASLVVGTIVGLFAINLDPLSNGWAKLIESIKKIMFYITPFAIGVGVGYKAELKPLQILAIMLGAGIAAHSTMTPNYIVKLNSIDWSGEIGISKNFTPGDVFCAWVVSVLFVYLFTSMIWETKLDIIIIPLVGVAVGLINSLFMTYITTTITVLLEWVIEHSVNKAHWAGILLSPVIGVIMGLALSLPTSSAAIALVLELHGDAASAAMAATAAQMISFGVMTYMATKSISKSLAVGIGTSMLQMKNFVSKPKLLIIPTIVSAIAAMLATSLLPLDFVSGTPTSGMGSCALYGQIFTLKENGWANDSAWLNVIFIQIIIPILITYGMMYWFQSKKWIERKELEI